MDIIHLAAVVIYISVGKYQNTYMEINKSIKKDWVKHAKVNQLNEQT